MHRRLFITGLMTVSPTAQALAAEGAVRTNAEIIRSFVDAWSRLDPDELASFFAEDGVYHNIPSGPVKGRRAIRDFITVFTKGWTSTQWDLLSLVSEGDVVVAERLDRTRLGDKAVDLPCCGVFHLENGKIKVWRDYFDLATYTRAFAPPG